MSREPKGGRNVFWEPRAGGGVNGIGANEAFEIPELSERADNFLWLGQDGDWVRFETGAGSLPGFELATDDEGGEGEFLFWEAERGAKEDLGRPAPVSAIRPSSRGVRIPESRTLRGRSDPRINRKTFIRQSCHAKANAKIPALADRNAAERLQHDFWPSVLAICDRQA
jgi:hypothetical protein